MGAAERRSCSRWKRNGRYRHLRWPTLWWRFSIRARIAVAFGLQQDRISVSISFSQPGPETGSSRVPHYGSGRRWVSPLLPAAPVSGSNAALPEGWDSRLGAGVAAAPWSNARRRCMDGFLTDGAPLSPSDSSRPRRTIVPTPVPVYVRRHSSANGCVSPLWPRQRYGSIHLSHRHSLLAMAH